MMDSDLFAIGILSSEHTPDNLSSDRLLVDTLIRRGPLLLISLALIARTIDRIVVPAFRLAPV